MLHIPLSLDDYKSAGTSPNLENSIDQISENMKFQEKLVITKNGHLQYRNINI